MSFTVASVDYFDADALTFEILIFLMALFILVSAAGALLQIYVNWSWMNSSLGLRTSSFLDLEEALGETSDPKQMIGLNKLFLESLPTFVFSKQMASEITECAVCLCEFQENEKGRLLPKCNHRFHVGCIDMWFHTHSTCPLCRASVGAEESLYFYPQIDEEMGFSSGIASSAAPLAACLNPNLVLKALTFDKQKIFEFVRQQGPRFLPWRQEQQPSPSVGPLSPKPEQFSVVASQAGSHSSAMRAGHHSMDMPQTCLTPSPSRSSTSSVDSPATSSSTLLHFNAIKRIFNTQGPSSGPSYLRSSFRDYEQGIEAV